MNAKNVRGLLAAIGLVLGIVLIFWGWDKNESTMLSRTKGAIFMILTGAAMFGGSFIWLVVMNGWGTRRN